MEQESIVIRGARQHNLKNVDLEIPRNAFTVVTGLSGSGKSSLAFDTIYAEGQRRYLECLSAYARQFLDMLEKPDVDLIEGLSPAISIEQKSTSGNPRSTVGTVTEIYDYLRLLFARVGEPRCHRCGDPVSKQSPEQIVDVVLQELRDKRVIVLAPAVRGRKGHYRELFKQILSDGFVRARVDGDVMEIESGFHVDRYKTHNIEIVVDRLKATTKSRARLRSSVEAALNHGGGVAIVFDGEKDRLFSRDFACRKCGVSYPEPAPHSFSFNSKYGACPDCEGLGVKKEFDPALIAPDLDKSINQEGLAALGKPRDVWIYKQIEAVADHLGFTFDDKLGDLTEEQRKVLFFGSKEKIPFKYRYGGGSSVGYKHRFNGVVGYLRHYYETTSSNKVREWTESYMTASTCETCGGGRLKPESLAVLFGGKNIAEISSLSLERAAEFFKKTKPTGSRAAVAKPILKEITSRLDFLLNVGLDYLSLERGARTLSGGESQRIRLATQIGAQLSGALYVLDEPSIGLHQSDNVKLINSLKRLRDLENTIIVVEHDKETIESSDYLVDLGLHAGEHGGEVCAAGWTSELLAERNGAESLTLDYMRNLRRIEYPDKRRDGSGKFIELLGARGNNLKNVDLKLPLGKLVAVTGVSGSGKSSLFNETLVKILTTKLYRSKTPPLDYREIKGIDHIDKAIEIDQAPIGRTPRSNPATYTGVFTFIRDLYSSLPESKMRGYRPGRFSFNVAGGRCEECGGDGMKKIEMNFLPDVYVTCDVCKGRRYNRETLEVLYKRKSIADVLDMTADEAFEFFEDLPRIRRKLETIKQVGLGYIRLGQQSPTLSGGEAQRVKLATELSKVGTGKTIYFLDEPTTGLHFEDVRVLMVALNRLADKGNTVVVVEHNLDVIKQADWVIDLGPGGGERGGEIVAEGTPEAISKNKRSVTGEFLKRELDASKN